MYTIGVDEVGRGALAGDLIVAACAFVPGPAGQEARRWARDSKAFKSRALREQAAAVVRPGVRVVFARRTPADIDRLNIRGAVLSAFVEAAQGLVASAPAPVRLLWDGKDCPPAVWPDCVVESRAVVKGDALVPEIAAASVLAKVLRDQEMDELATLYPAYGWARNAGYGTAAHIAAIAQYGLCPHHRSWAAKFVPPSGGL